ncbi:MAG TPA: lysophospholipid acyltransferase family protein [Kofleriaceae bacterium]|nr:lysophospholipid acyltransferase family protein [Kofleriaceae bacterium]
MTAGWSGAERGMLVYRVLQWLLRVATRVFFRRVEVVGRDNVPRTGPVLFCGNHPNSLLDPILITAHGGRVVQFAAKDTLFDSPVLGFFLRRMGAVPVRRRMDHPDGALDNDAAFAALHEVLAEGRAIGIFPEGISHLDSQLAPLKTGAARIALGAVRRPPGQVVHMVPTGLVYTTRHRFRSSVLIQFGAPIAVDAGTVERAGGDDKAAARWLTDQIEARLRALTVNADSWDTAWVLDGVRRLYQPEGLSLEQRIELARRFNTVYPQVAHHEDVRALFGRVRTYLTRLSADGIGDEVVRRGVGLRDTAARVIGHLALLLFWAPLALIGAPLHVPLGLLFRYAGRSIAPRKDAVATAKFVLGFLTLLAVYGGLAALAGWRFGLGAAGLTLLVLPLSGWALVHVIGRLDALRHLALTLARVVRLGRELDVLRAERAALVEEVTAAVDRHRPADMDPMFG